MIERKQIIKQLLLGNIERLKSLPSRILYIEVLDGSGDVIKTINLKEENKLKQKTWTQ